MVIDEESRIVGIFTLTHKAVQLLDAGLTGTVRKKIQCVWMKQRTPTYYLLFWLRSLEKTISMGNQMLLRGKTNN